MTILQFKASDVLRVVQHAKAATKWRLGYGQAPEDMAPCVFLVHDQGVYLMSGGLPRDVEAGAGPRAMSFCAYAKGMHPEKDDDWWEAARLAVGGDDFSERLGTLWMDRMLALAVKGKQVRIEVTRDNLRLVEG